MSGANYEIPESGAVFTFGRSRFAENQASHFFIKNDSIVGIACGDEHTAIVCENGRVFVFGSNNYGQLGLGHTKSVSKPSCVKLVKPYHSVLVACGKGHTLVATDCGRLFAFGSNSDGQLGLGDNSDRSTPTEIQLDVLGETGSKIKALAAGCFHSALLTDAGQVFTWGCNNDGQCGSNSTSNILTPTKLSMDAAITAISCGYYHTLIAGEEGAYTMGEADNGKLGRSDGEPQTQPVKINLSEQISRVTCGGNHSVVLTESGDVYGFGSNFSGQLGTGPSPIVSSPTKIEIPKPVIQVGCGESHTAFVTEDGELYVCGDTRHGKLCLDDVEGTSLATPTLVPAFEPYVVTGVSCGGCHTMVLAKMKGDASDVDIVCQTKSLPPLKVRNATGEENGEHVEEEAVSTEMAVADGEDPNCDDDVETRTVVLKMDSQQLEEDGDSKSNTESSINVDDVATSPVDDIYSEIREFPSDAEMNSPRKEVHTSDSGGSVVVKPPTRMQKILRVFKKKKPVDECQSLTASTEVLEEEVFTKNGEKVGNQTGSKACVIL